MNNKKETIITFYTEADFKNPNSLTYVAQQIIDAIKPNIIYCRDHDNDDPGYKKLYRFGSILPKAVTAITMMDKSIGWDMQEKLRDLAIINSHTNWGGNVTEIKIFHYTSTEKVLNYFKDDPNVITVSIVTSVTSPKVLTRLMEENKKTKEPLDLKRLSKYHNATKLSDYIICWSDFVKQEFVNDGYQRDKAFVSYNCVKTDPDYTRKHKLVDPFRLLSVGNFNTNKGIHYAVQAWCELVDEYKINPIESVFYIVGHKYPEIKKMITEKVNSREYGVVDINETKDVSYYYKHCNCFILPSFSEGAARVNYEAMNYEMPVITTRESGSVVEDMKSGLIVESGNVKEMKNAIMYYHNNYSVAKKHGKYGRETLLRHYSHNSFKERLKSIINKIKIKEC